MKGLSAGLLTPYRFLAITTAVLAFFVLSATRASAAITPVVEILSPMPNAIQYTSTTIQYEIEITDGDIGDNFRIEWDGSWGGVNPDEPFLDHVQEGIISSFPANATTSDHPGLSFLYTTAATGGQVQYRVRVTDVTTGLSVIKTGKYYILQTLAFSGYTWTGASTADGGPDALGWTSYSCSNQNLVCSSNPSYGVKLSFSPSGNRFATLQNNAWLGEESPSGAGVLGWMTFSNAYCNGGSRSGEFCSPPAFTCPGGTCEALGDPPGGVCVAGLFPGQVCYSDYDCPDEPGDPPLGTSPCTSPDPEDWGNSEFSFLYSSGENYVLDDGNAQRFSSQLAGWSRLQSLREYASTKLGLEETPNGVADDENQWGWVHLRGPEVPTGTCSGGSTPGALCTEGRGSNCPGGGVCTPSFTNRYTNVASGGYHDCRDCSAGDAKCNICAKVQIEPSDAEEDWKSYSCNSCYNCDASGNCSVCQKCDQYGVSYDSQKGQLVGFAWAGGQEEGGAGWVQFDPLFGGIGVLQAWLATRYGDIFVGGPITVTTPLPSPPGTFNATYVIQANGTIAFTSETGYLQPNYPSNIQLPTAGNQYVNVLGRIDFATMALADGVNSNTHRYGKTVRIDQAAVDAWSTVPPILDGTIYYAKGDIAINAPIEFQPGAIGSQSGAGTIIVDGNLSVNADIVYDTDQLIGNIANLPSVAWLVRGDLNIDPNVGSTGSDTTPDLVGAFLVVGCPGTLGGPCGDVVKDGVISTGENAALELVVNGLMMARRFNFQRTVASDRGSEQVVYDGRLIANPPPGLQDLTAVLPVIREVTP